MNSFLKYLRESIKYELEEELESQEKLM